MNPPWDARFEALVRAALRLLEPDDPLPPDLRTADYGLDSLAMVELMLGIEETYEISIPDDVVKPQIFATPENLWNVVSELCGTGSSSVA
ncbi:phosphopantetheine-binding protein [Streptomyces sp. S.PNR 29]|uniref:phosphopantetheine-binding protein n=1 Tax=Streptomyces sp. S.PNR 29 TaxID=2973805 RepID=UPI0025B20752|nr:phosphopantetheine-binding protein [Streptomyces sp. S.PNR 29]MDN0197618.1 phosphopantetheine-binding protein [Streptomyces sp. S.PNR 29]